MTKILTYKSDVDLDYPICRPSLDLDFTQEVLDSRITFSRGSIGTRVNRNRLIETVDANQPRFDYDPVTGECKGLLIEEGRTNLVLNSLNGYQNLFPQNTSVITGIDAPDGSNTAIRVSCRTTGSTLIRMNTGTLSNSTTYTGSFYVRLISGNTAASNQLTSDICDGVDINYLPLLVANKWVRISYSGFRGLTSNPELNFIDLLSDRTNNYILDFWGAQVEQGAFPTSYIPTSGSTVTRSTDFASITGTNFSSWFNQTEGTLYAAARIGALGGSNYPGIVYVDDGTLNNCIGLVVMDATNDQIATEAYVSGLNQYFLGSSTAIIPNQLSKAITAYQQNNFASAFSNRNNIQRDINGSIPTVNRMIIGRLRGGGDGLNGTISRLTYYPRRLKDNQLVLLTQ